MESHDVITDNCTDQFRDSEHPETTISETTYSRQEIEGSKVHSEEQTLNGDEYNTIQEHTRNAIESTVCSKNFTERRIYNTSIIPPNFGESQSFRNTIIRLIERIEITQGVQNNVDDIYQKFLDMVHSEMDEVLPYKDISTNKKTPSRFTKRPYFNKRLKDLWKFAVGEERKYTKFKGSRSSKKFNPPSQP